MAESRVMSESKMVAEEQTRVGSADGPLLAAALAAALVEYRRHVGQRKGHGRSGSTGIHWRMMTRLEQLGQPAPFRFRGRG